jgi:hypothetical protein
MFSGFEFGYALIVCNNFGFILQVLAMVFYRSRSYPSNIVAFTFLFFASEVTPSNKYRAPW